MRLCISLPDLPFACHETLAEQSFPIDVKYAESRKNSELILTSIFLDSRFFVGLALLTMTINSSACFPLSEPRLEYSGAITYPIMG